MYNIQRGNTNFSLKYLSCSLCSDYSANIYIIAKRIITRIRFVWGGADKSLARPGRKQATATKLWNYLTYSPRSSIHFLAHRSNFCKPLKKNSEGFPSNQVSAIAMTSASDKKWQPFNCFFFQSRERMVFRRGQIRRIGWAIKTLEGQVGQFLLGCKCPVSRGIVMQEQDPPWWNSRGVFPSKCPSVAPAEMSNTTRW